MTAVLLGLGTALPPRSWSQEELAVRCEREWGLAAETRARWHRIARGSGIDRRHVVVDPSVVLSMTTGERMALYEQEAPVLALPAAQRALDDAGVGACEITDLVVVSCQNRGRACVLAQNRPVA